MRKMLMLTALTVASAASSGCVDNCCRAPRPANPYYAQPQQYANYCDPCAQQQQQMVMQPAMMAQPMMAAPQQSCCP